MRRSPKEAKLNLLKHEDARYDLQWSGRRGTPGFWLRGADVGYECERDEAQFDDEERRGGVEEAR